MHVLVNGRSRAGDRRCVVAFSALVLAGALLAAPAAHGQSASDEAEALIRQGTELRHQGEDARALPYFEGAYHLSRTPRSAAQLGLVKMALGYCVDAERLLTEALAVPDHPWIARNRATLEQTLTNARKNIGEVTVTGSPDGAQVLVNGRPAGTLPLAGPLKLDRGPVELQLQARGYVPATRALTIAGGARSSLTIALLPVGGAPAVAAAPPVRVEPPLVAPAAAPAPADVARPIAIPVAPAPAPETPAQEPDHAPLLRPLAWTAGGVAAASLVFAIVETVTSGHRIDDFNNHTGPAPLADDPTHRAPDCQTAQLSDECRSLRDDWQRARTLAIVGYVGAGVFAGAAATLFVLSHRPAPPESPPATGLACAPALPSPGLTCALRF